MADKEVTVFVIDVSKNMGNQRPGTSGSILQWCLEYVWDKVGIKIMSGRKTDYVAVVAVGADVTDHPLGDEEAYEYIRVILPFPNRKKDDLRSYAFSKSMADLMLTELYPSSTNHGDLLSAVIVGIHMITEFCQELKFKKNLILITVGEMLSDYTDAEAITTQINTESIKFSVLGIDFDDSDYGFKEEDKSVSKTNNERSLRKICEDTEGIFATFAEVVESMATPRIKTVRPVTTFKGILSIGNADTFTNAVQINVERYPKTKQAKAPAATKFSLAAETRSVHMQASQKPEDDSGRDDFLGTTHQVVPSRAYKLQDGQELAGRSQLEKGYSYGKTIVPISKADEDFLKFETQVGLQILGFLEAENYARYMGMGETSLIVAQKANIEAALAISSLVHALFESENYALARLVKKDNTPPVMVLLAPDIEPDFEALLEVALPYAEDVRQYKFAPLNRIKTSKGVLLTKHRYLPSDGLNLAMSNLMDAMNLDTLRDADGIETDALCPGETFSFGVHRVQQAVLFRAFHQSSEPIPSASEPILHVSRIPRQVSSSAKFLSSATEVTNVADVKKVPPKTAHRKRQGARQEAVKTGIDLDELLGEEDPNANDRNTSAYSEQTAGGQRLNSIGQAHPLDDFETMMRKDEMIDIAFSQIQPVILELVQYSLGEQTFDLALQCIRAFRAHAIEQEESEMFNDFLKRMDKKMREEDRDDFVEYFKNCNVDEIGEAEARGD